MPSATTIKVSRDLRDRIAHDAAAAGLTAGAFLDRLVADYERAERMRAVGRAYEQVDDEYARESAAWEGIDDDGVPE